MSNQQFGNLYRFLRTVMESFLLKKFLFEWKEKEGIKLGKGIIEEIREHFFLSF